MVSYWVFTLTEYSEYNSGDKEAVMKKALDNKTWPIGNRTTHRNNVKNGDLLLFYVSGENNRKFIGKAKLASGYIPNDETEGGYVKINDIQLFKEPVPIKPLIDDLEFIKLKSHWGLFLSSGINRITEKDYKAILG